VNDVLDDAVSEMRAIVLWSRDGLHQEHGEALRMIATACETVAASERLRSVLASFGVQEQAAGN